VKHVPSARKRLLSVGKAYHDGIINCEYNGVVCRLKDSAGSPLGYAEHTYPYQWLADLRITDKHVSFSSKMCM
jgi:hypothetical protein